jgi:putative aldouronate transport system substrate-binding protein
LNIFYTKAGSLLMNYGLEGEQYYLDADGNPIYTDTLKNDPDGATNALWRDCRNDGPGEVDFRKFWQLSGGEYQLDAYAEWAKNKPEDSSVDAATLSSDETRDYSSIMSDVETYVSENIVQFIMGTRSLDQYDAFVQQLKDMGIEQALQIKQNAWNRYIAR